MRAVRRLVLAAVAVALAAPAAVRAETPIPTAPTRFVTDNAGLISAQARAELDARLEAYERGTGHQLLVYVDRTTGGAPIEDWAVRAFAAWKVGRKGIDDGAVLFIFTTDRRMRIEVGYGLEGLVPDATAKRIIDERIAPKLRAADGDGAVRAGADGLMAAIGGTLGPPRGPGQLARPPVPPWMFVVGIVLFFVLLGVAARNPAFAAWMLYVIMSGRRGGGGWGGGGFGGRGLGGGGGGFSGGGGRSGGGGASGSW